LSETNALKGPTRLIAIGGGGFTHGTDPALEDFILARSGLARPCVGFIASASGDDPLKIERFHQRFAAHASAHTVLPSGADARSAAAWLHELDIVYVGGGHTLRLIEQWQRSGLDRLLIEAANRGVLMAGVSAGASAWFSHALSDAGGQGLAPICGIGMVAGSCCPHYDSEPARVPAFAECIARGELPAGIAIDDGAAVLMEGGACVEVCAARPGAGAHRVWRDATGAQVQRM
jgi:dipeptidase E